MIEGIDPFASIATAALLLLSIALSAPSLALMTDARIAASSRLRLDATIGISVLCAGISLGIAYESRAVALLGLACAIAGLLAFDRRGTSADLRGISGLRLWASAALFLTYLAQAAGS